MSTDPINIQPAFQSNDKKGYIRSVSLIFYSQSKGYLLCDEIRKGFPNPANRKLENHMIGGKCDLEDSLPIISGFREFIEETGFPTKGKLDILVASQLANDLADCKTIKWDTCVNPGSKKTILWNRFYVINLDTGSNLDLISFIHDFILNWRKNSKVPLESIYWWKPDEELKVPSNLLTSFTKNLPPTELLI